jgi:hypothetical protein
VLAQGDASFVSTRGKDSHLFDLDLELAWEAMVDESGGMPPMGGDAVKKPTKYTGTMHYPEFTSTTKLEELDCHVQHGKKTVAHHHKNALEEATGALRKAVQQAFEGLISAYADK